MTFYTTPSSPTRMQRVSAQLAATWLVAASLSAQAHELDGQPAGDQPGWRLGVELASLIVSANDDWPKPHWRGVLTNGQTLRDQRGAVRLEHGVLDLAIRPHVNWGAQFTVGWHDREPAHVEAARLHASWQGHAGQWIASAGRSTISLGETIDRAGHLDHYAQVPLAKRALFNDQWIDDGVTLAWQGQAAGGLRVAELGLWSARAYPGGPQGPLAPTLRLSAQWGAYSVDGFATHLEPQGRGAIARTTGLPVHTHAVPDCRISVSDLVCFDGQVDLLASSVRWLSSDARWTISAAGMLRRERGQMASNSGQAHMATQMQAMWLDAAWAWRPAWIVAARVERLVPTNELNGTGVQPLAREAGWQDSGRVDRITMALERQLASGLTLSLEAGRETDADRPVSHLALRLRWADPQVLRGSW